MIEWNECCPTTAGDGSMKRTTAMWSLKPPPALAGSVLLLRRGALRQIGVKPTQSRSWSHARALCSIIDRPPRRPLSGVHLLSCAPSHHARVRAATRAERPSRVVVVGRAALESHGPTVDQ